MAATRSPTRTTNVAIDELPVGMNQQVFRRLFDSRILYLKGPIEDTEADTLVAQMLALDAESDDDITLYINSPGGVIHGLFAILDSMNLLRSKVNTRCVGMAASAAAVILAAGTGTRSATENARGTPPCRRTH
jgi:ATP-dependent Clp protease, protease subunit